MMKTTRRLLMILLVISVLLSMMSPTVALPADKTTQEKAQLLNTLKMISGTNGEFNLSNQVRRSEAAAFIVNLLGKGAHVTANKAQYSLTTYTDVPSTQWYALYIGFCSQNGYVIDSSTEFKPLDFITEKEFLKLVMLAMEYRENIDFTADTIYDKARELGLITLNEYINFSTEGVSKIPTRGNVVDVLYAALSLNTRTGYKMAQKLIDEKVVSRIEAMALGLINDSKVTSILSAENTGLDTIQVKFNEAIESIYETRVYPKSSASDYLTCQAITITEDTVEIQTTPLEIGKTYVVEFTDVKDTEGNIYGKLFVEFTGAEPKEIQSNFFRIRKVEPVNERSIKVFFTHPLTINSEVCLYYSILKDNTVIADGMNGEVKAGVLNSDKTGVLLSLNRDLAEGEIYTLKIDGNMMSAYGVGLNDGKGDSMKFAADASMDDTFRLVEIHAMDKRTLLLNFNKEINPFLAQQIFNFYLTDASNKPIKINNTSLDDIGTVVYVNIEQDLNKNQTYYLTINNLNDITKQEYITEQTYSFIADFSATSSFVINGANAVDNRTIEVRFNKALDKDAALNLSNYLIYMYTSSSLIRPEKVLYDYYSDPYSIKLYLPQAYRLYSQYDYRIKIGSSMKDYSGNYVNMTEGSFRGTDNESTNIDIDEITPVSSDSIKVYLSKEMEFSCINLMPSNFTLEYSFNRNSIKKIPISVIYIDSRTLILKFDSLVTKIPYKLRISELSDFTGKVVKNCEELFEFDGQ
jgi:hypothetical protein